MIRPGDTMWSISRNLARRPRAFRRLAETNEIEDPNTIFPGSGCTSRGVTAPLPSTWPPGQRWAPPQQTSPGDRPVPTSARPVISLSGT